MGNAPLPLVAAYRTAWTLSAAPLDDAVVEVRASWDDDLLEVSHLSDGDRFTLSSRGAATERERHLVLPSSKRAPHALVTVRGEVVTVTPPDGAAFELLEPVTLHHDGVTFDVRRVARAERLPPPRRQRFAGISCAVALAITGVISRVPVRERPPWERRDDDTHEWIVTHVTPRASVAYSPTHADTTGIDEGGNGQRARGDEGRAGRRHAASQNQRWLRRPSHPQRGIETNIAASVATRGVFAALGAQGPSVTRFMPGVTERVADTGNMYGDLVGTSRGENALGLIGAGFGGGGTGEGLIGLGRIGTRGHGDNTSDGQGIGGSGWGCGCLALPARGSLGMRGMQGHGFGAVRSGAPSVCFDRADGVVRDPACVASTSSGADSAMIRRVVRANIGQVRHCYERALEVNPSAEGTLTVRWVIGGDGRVLASGVVNDPIGDASLSECVASAVRRWSFTVPADTVVTVSYPFALSREER